MRLQERLVPPCSESSSSTADPQCKACNFCHCPRGRGGGILIMPGLCSRPAEPLFDVPSACLYSSLALHIMAGSSGHLRYFG